MVIAFCNVAKKYLQTNTISVLPLKRNINYTDESILKKFQYRIVFLALFHQFQYRQGT